MDGITSIQESTKIIIVGLDNCGKSSILVSLKEDSNLLSFITLHPTRGVNIEEILAEDKLINVLDLGGQQQYRQSHLEKFKELIVGVKTLIFVIDVQDFKRYKLALNYFKGIIDLLNESKNFINISIYLHKYDPNLKKQKRYQDIDNKINTELIIPIEQIIPSEFKYNFFKTAIYTVFEKTLVK